MKNVQMLVLGCLISSGCLSAHAASDYHKYFMFKVEGDCSNMHEMRFQNGVSDDIELGLNEQQKPLVARVRIQLFENGTFWALYSEHSIQEVFPEARARVTGQRTEFEQSVEGNWSIKGKRLELSGLGIGIIPELEEISHPAITLKITQTINDPRALNKQVEVSRYFSNTALKGKSIIEYCGGKK